MVGSRAKLAVVIAVLGSLVLSTGCSTFGAKEPGASPLDAKLKEQEAAVQDLTKRLQARDAQLVTLQKSLQNERSRANALQRENEGLREQLAAKPTGPKADVIDMEALKAKFGSEVEVTQVGRAVAVTLPNEVLFDSGKASLNARGASTLHKAADVIRSQFPGKKIVIQGHTDNEPIKKSNFRSNWELSAARALAVLHHLIDKEGFKPDRLSAEAFGETQPVASNSSAAGRKKNRRAVIVIETE
jgi:chemotaxis protein MotB